MSDQRDKGLKKIGEAIGFAAIVAGTVTLEINGHSTGLLWLLIVIWAISL